jgi:hypothetical protein
MQRRTADGGLTTTDEQITHTVWPCVHHSPDVPCIVAQRNASRYGMRTLRPQPKKAPDAPQSPTR